MDLIYYINLCVLLWVIIVHKIRAWQYFTTLNQLQFYGTESDPMHLHSEYIFGDCKDNVAKGRVLFTRIHMENVEVLGKIIIRGWLNIYRIPTCIILRGRSYIEDTFRNTASQYQFCVPRISYCYARKRYRYYYYEWYIPSDMTGGMTWDIYLYGPPERTFH